MESKRSARTWEAIMAKLRIDRGDLLLAMESHDSSWYLDRQTGDVILRSDDFDDELDLGDELDDDVEPDEYADPGVAEALAAISAGSPRYVAIDPVPSHRGFRIMEDFVATLPDGAVHRELSHALDRRRPFRSFKDALYGFPEVREAWYRSHERRMLEEARGWLEAEGIDAELVDRYVLAEGGTAPA
jgi:Uncharacterised protein family (UPF0158)